MKAQEEFLPFVKSQREIIEENIRLFHLPPRTKDLIESVLSGRVLERSLICCHSACDVCNATIRKCIIKIRRDLESNE